eukprot:TRINITY_DN34468_c0_g1_i2.p1 TRINITY_DN34468_c0_g1~~TRINITY_DN34468_c0_g1_i2.p1  ORF type:complete len:257 (-),score=31.61 TRINITY_DN34468_c0_g1_i2:559-1329(-)
MNQAGVVLYKYSEFVSGQLVRRYKRFLADVIIRNENKEQQVTVHCPNTGPMTGLLDRELAPVMLSISNNKKRKYAHTLEQIEIEDGLNVGVHSALANTFANSILEAGLIESIGQPSKIKKEVKCNDSRIDFVAESETGDEWFVEVKSVTLAQKLVNGSKIALFPDTVSERAQKHMRTLMDLQSSGQKSMCLYIVQRPDCACFAASKEKDPDYAKLVEKAQEMGVALVAVSVYYDPQQYGIVLGKTLPVELQYDLEV